MTSILKRALPSAAELAALRKPKGAIRYKDQNEKARILVLEEGPMNLRVSWKSKSTNDHEMANELEAHYESFKVTTPWQYFIVRLTHEEVVTDTFLFFSPERIKKKADKVHLPTIPNIYPSGHICNGTIRIILTDPEEKKARDLFNAFWTTPFTSETWPKLPALLPKALSFWGANSRHPKSLLMAWEAACYAKTPIDWRSFRVRVRRRVIPYLTLAGVMKYALNFPDRTNLH
jgi:hypothetical protein